MKLLSAVLVTLLLAVSLSAQTPTPPRKPKTFPAYKPSCLVCGKTTPPQVSARFNAVQSTTDTLESPWSVSVSGGVSTINGATNDGFLASTEIRAAQHWSARVDTFSLASTATVAALAGPEYFAALCHLIPPNSYINTCNIVPFFNVKLGDVNGPLGNKFAGGAGLGFNLVLSPTLTVRPFDVSWIRSSGLTGNQAILGNHLQYLAAVTLTLGGGQ